MKRLVIKAFCKVLEGISRVATAAVSLAQSDPTEILLRNFTVSQSAAAALQKNLPVRVAEGNTKLLVLIPFRDHWRMTTECLASLARQKLTSTTCQILLIDNGSHDTATADGVASQLREPLANGFKVTTLRVDEPFNFSRLNNLGLKAAADFAPDRLFFLNNDVELRGDDDLERLLQFADSCPNLGALGCTLLFPDQRIQHLFLAPGVKIVGAHPFKGARLADSAAWFAEARPVAAVTGAALLVATADFTAVGGFDEELPTVGQDLDLCLKLQKYGRTNWVLPSVRMLHKEGASKGKAIAKAEVATMYAKWGEFLTKNPLYSQRLSRYSETPVYRLLEPAYPWEKILP